MSQFPFHVAGGALPFGRPAVPPPSLEEPAAAPLRASGSRRRRLWELPHKCHCPVIGTCFSCDELRGLLQKMLRLPRDASDFVLHTTAVGQCEERGAITDLLHKALEKRYQLTVKQFAALKTDAELRAAWRQACKEPPRIPAALWAAWTHPACDTRLEQEIYGDIHMIQHHVASGTRADLKAQRQLETDKVELQRQLEQLRAEAEQLRQERAEAQHASQREITELRAELAASQQRTRQLEQALADSAAPDLAERSELAARHADLAERHARLRGELGQRERENEQLRHALADALSRPASVTETPPDWPPCADLGGKSVLCIGGRAGAVHSYREVVEQSGGRFLHHDGGLEESLQRIDNAIAAADLVICQAGCISHNAYWRVKALCKRTGKPCMYVRVPSVSSFEKVVREAGQRQEPADELADRRNQINRPELSPISK